MADKEINKIIYGGRTFYQDAIKNGNMYLAASLLSEQLEVNTLEFDLVSDDTSLTNFVRNDKLAYYYDGKQVAIFYLQNVERTGARMYHFTANSAIGLLVEGLHYGGIYTGQTVEEVLPGIMGTVPYYIKSNLKPIKLYGWLPVAAPRDNLSQVLFAIGATVKTDLDGYLRIESFWDSASSLTGKDRIYNGAKVSYASPITSIAVTEHQYVAGSESTNLFEGTAAANDIVTFNEPMHSLSASGFTILESGANYARLSAGSGVLKGLRYVHNTRQITKTVSSGSSPNIKKVENATLISLVNSQATAVRLANYYKWLETVDAAVVYKGEKPGDRVQIWHPYNSLESTACLQSADITLSNTLKAQEKALIGYIPPATEDVVVYDHKTILTGNGTWQIPSGTTSARAILIGGGSGGQAGYNGEAGADTESVTSSRGLISYSVGGKGGKGGNGGMGGDGGKILIVDLAISNTINSLSYACGAGGKGGASNGAQGTSGGNTSITLGQTVYRSSSGSSSGGGYVDIETGDSYAIFGAVGQSGGDGGDGGTWTSSKDPSQAENGDEANGYDGQDIGLLNPGGKGGNYAVERGGTSSSANVGWANVTCGAGGGGAAMDNRGLDASSDHNGGAGARGTLSTTTNQKYGSGGSGGNGGGGGGGAAGVLAATASDNTYGHTNEGRKGGVGGLGSGGGSGAPGCIILYYGIPRTTSSGWLKTSDGRFFTGNLKRRFVV